MAKSIFYSKTFWMAVIQGVIGVVAAIELQNPMPALLIIKSILDIALRFATAEPIK